MDETATVKSKVHQLDSILAAKVAFPTMKITIMHGMLKDAKEETHVDIPICELSLISEIKENQELLYSDSDGKQINDSQSLGSLTVETTEEGFSQLLRLLPADCVVCTICSTAVSSLNFPEKCLVQTFTNNLSVKTVEKFCLIHFHQINDILRLPLKETNDMNENTYKSLCDLVTKANMCMKHMPALSLRKVGDEVGSKMQAFTCLLYTSPSPRDATLSRMPSSA